MYVFGCDRFITFNCLDFYHSYPLKQLCTLGYKGKLLDAQFNDFSFEYKRTYKKMYRRLSIILHKTLINYNDHYFRH